MNGKKGPVWIQCYIFCVVDLVPQENVEKWIQCLQLEYPVVAFKASTQIKDKTVVGSALDTLVVKPKSNVIIWRTEKVEQLVLL